MYINIYAKIKIEVSNCVHNHFFHIFHVFRDYWRAVVLSASRTFVNFNDLKAFLERLTPLINSYFTNNKLSIRVVVNVVILYLIFYGKYKYPLSDPFLFSNVYRRACKNSSKLIGCQRQSIIETAESFIILQVHVWRHNKKVGI